ncbi:HSP90 family protein [Demequina sp.]|uniref:HSP90 family protein n=1 Tax=Demequina sp. TaxID=2050685 RepID=UPI003D110054
MSEFGVDLRGVIDLLSRHIYSGPEVYLRELLQNSRDAIIARADHHEPNPDWAIRIRPATADNPFVMIDDGIGLAADEVADLLATVGRSSKRDMLDLPNEDFLGHFGIGLLSCFMVADTIEILSRKDGRPACVWRGSADGTYAVEELPAHQSDAVPIGTRVTLRPSFDRGELLGPDAVARLARMYAEFLPVPVVLERDGESERISGDAPFLLNAVTHRAQVLAYGHELIGHEPLDAIPLRVPGTATTGVGYVLRGASGLKTRGARVYVGRMLLSPDEPQLVPDWAFFLRPVVTSDVLTPTASRESLVRDDALKATRDGIADAVRAWVRDLAERNQPRLREFLSVHDLAIRAACREDEELFRIVGPYLTFETAAGPRELRELAQDGDVQFAPSLDEFRMLSGLGTTGTLVNGSYVHHEELLTIAPQIFAGLNVSRADVVAWLAELDEPAVEDLARTSALAARATAALTDVDVEAVVKVLPGAEVPSLYVADARVLTRVDLTRASEIAKGPWAAVLRTAATRVDETAEAQGRTATRAQICLNWASPLVQRLASLDDGAVLDRGVRLLYVQALLAGRRPLTERDRALMSQSLDDLITLSVGLNREGTHD